MHIGDVWRKRTILRKGEKKKKKENNYHGWTVYSNICGVVVIELFRTISINTIQENGTTFPKSVDQMELLVDTCLSIVYVFVNMTC